MSCVNLFYTQKKLDSLSCSFTSISFLTNWPYHCNVFIMLSFISAIMYGLCGWKRNCYEKKVTVTWWSTIHQYQQLPLTDHKNGGQRHITLNIQCRLFIVGLCLYWCLRSNYQDERVTIPLTSSTSPDFCACPKPIPGFLAFWFFFLQWFEVRGSCSLCWYWWNCWQSPFKLSYHNVL